jgi:hypothetical protein
MYQRCGRLESAKTKEKVILINKEGRRIQVNFVVAFVWEAVGARKSPERIAHMLSTQADVSLRKAQVAVDAAIMTLLDIGLLEQH